MFPLIIYLADKTTSVVSAPEKFTCFGAANKTISAIKRMYVSGSFRAKINAFYIYDIEFKYKNGTLLPANAGNVLAINNWFDLAPDNSTFDCYVSDRQWSVGYLSAAENTQVKTERRMAALIAFIVLLSIGVCISVISLFISSDY